jgi:MFS family permease
MPSSLFSGPFARVTVANFFFFLNFASFFLLPLHLKALGASEGVVGSVMGTTQGASLLATLVVGTVIDRVGRRRFFVVGTAGMTLAAIAYVFPERIEPWFYALRAIQGVCFAAAFAASSTLAAELAPPDRRAQALGIFGVSTLLTHAIAPALGEEIVHRGGFHALFLSAAACTLVPIPLLRGVPARPPAALSSLRERVRLSPTHGVIFLTMALTGMGFGAVNTFVPTFVRGHNLGRVGFFYGSYSLTAVLTRVIGGGLSDSLGRRTIVLPALLGFASSILALALVQNVWMLVFAGLLFGAAQGMSYPTLQAFLVDVTPWNQLGRSQAYFNGAFNLGVMTSAFLFGVVADHIGQRFMFSLAAATPLLAAMVFHLGNPRTAAAAGGAASLEETTAS